MKKRESYTERESARALELSIHLAEGARMPQRGHPSDVGLDLWVISCERRDEKLYLYDTGVTVVPPDGYYVELLPRSSIAWRGFILPNSVGVIDPSYRGSLKLPLRYVGEGDAERAAQDLIGERVAQLVLRELIPCELKLCSLDELPAPRDARGEGGFGSTGRR